MLRVLGLLRCIAFASFVFLSGCGGGGGAGQAETLAAFNSPPGLTLNLINETLEGTSNLGGISYSDANNDSITLSLEGEDADVFAIDSEGNLQPVSQLDYEKPFDSDLDNVYRFTVVASDAASDTKLEHQIEVINAFEGRVVDGPLQGSLVFIDLNGNKVFDSGETATTTDEAGQYFLPLDVFDQNTDALVVSVGGVDQMSGQELSQLVLYGQPFGDIGQLQITPISTILAESPTLAD